MTTFLAREYVQKCVLFFHESQIRCFDQHVYMYKYIHIACAQFSLPLIFT